MQDLLENFSFSEAPALVRCKENLLDEIQIDARMRSRWLTYQKAFLKRIQDRTITNKEYIDRYRNAYDLFFLNRGFLKGDVLDIGGGWGLFREWWQPDNSSVYIVHDPGIERFCNGPSGIHLQLYRRAFSLPMTFVEGFGENLPYADKIFDTCLVAATLDHCVDPYQVIKEAIRCLKVGGNFLIIQYFYNKNKQETRTGIEGKSKYYSQLRRLVRVLYKRFFHTDHHLHRFEKENIINLLRDMGFSCTISTIPDIKNVCALELLKKETS